MYQPHRGLCRTMPLTATVRELAGSLPEGMARQVPCSSGPRRPRLGAASVLRAIADDAIRAAAKASATLISVGPAEPGDPTLLFLRKNGETHAQNTAQNLATLRHFALNIVRQDGDRKVGVANSRKRAGFDRNYLIKLLTGVSE